jgi:sialic acid synthase SpsE
MIYVAEATINHLGSTNVLKAMITEAKSAGADYVKFKFKDVASYYPDDGKKWRGMNFKAYRNSLEINRADVQGIVDHCNEIGIRWFTTVHDQASLDFIKPFGPHALKIASMDAANEVLLNLVVSECQELSIPMVYSMGGKTHEFFVDALRKIEEADIDCHILHCVSIYPTPDGMSNCGYVSKMLWEVNPSGRVSIGYSGHEVGYAASIIAALNGATMIERHFSLSRDFKIHHLECALLPNEFRDMIDCISRVLNENSSSSDISTGESRFLDDKDYGS